MPIAYTLPTAADLRRALGPLSRQQLLALADASGVSFNTLKKIASGETTNPLLDTASQLSSHIDIRPAKRSR